MENNLDRIIKDCQNGKSSAAEQIYKMFGAKMYAVCLRYSESSGDAEDALHDGFIHLFKVIGQYKAKGSFEGWMRRIFINIVLAKFRRNNPISYSDNVNEYYDDSYLDDEEDIDEDSDIPMEKLKEFIEELPSQYKLVFSLYVIEGQNHSEIAKLLGISEGTSKSNLSRARKILKNKIEEYIKKEK